MFSISFTDGTIYQPTKIVAVGQNYSEHIKEMNSVRTKDPVLFLKPSTALCDMSQPLSIPKNFGSVHHEIELAACIGKTAKNIDAADAMDFVAGYGMILDLTLRDKQTEAKKAGLPWAIAKGFDGACPVSVFVPKEKITDPHNLALTLKVNGEIRQSGHTSQMLTRIPELMAFITQFYTLVKGDLILTGTPSGVGPVTVGDRLEASLENIASIKTKCI